MFDLDLKPVSLSVSVSLVHKDRQISVSSWLACIVSQRETEIILKPNMSDFGPGTQI